MTPVVTVEQAKANGRTWLFRALAFIALYVFLWHFSRTSVNQFGFLIACASWWCITVWSEWRGYVKGWQANTRERQHHG